MHRESTIEAPPVPERFPADAPAVEAKGWLSVIEKMIDKNVNADLLSRVFEMQRTWEAEQQRKEFVAAFAAFKADAPSSIARTGNVNYTTAKGQTEYDHVELDVACAALVPIMSRHGLAHSWETIQDEKTGLISVTCRIEHAGGHSKSVTLRGMPDASGSKNPIQAVGSAVYYLERYTLLAALGIAQGGKDSDAQSCSAFITPEQVAEINTELERVREAGIQLDFKRWLKWCGVDSLDKIPASDFSVRIADLRKRLPQVSPAVQEALKKWESRFVGDGPTMNELNTTIKDELKAMPAGEVRTAVWNLIKQRVGEKGVEVRDGVFVFGSSK